LLFPACWVLPAGEEFQAGEGVLEGAVATVGLVMGSLCVEEEPPGQDSIGEAAMEGDGLDGEVTAPVGQVLLEVPGSRIPVNDRFDGAGEQEARFLGRPGDVDALRADPAGKAPLGTRQAKIARAGGPGFGHAALAEFFSEG